jgi:Na+-translocating ferredoxin:NAD+ oxidoreductase RnfG subunit
VLVLLCGLAGAVPVGAQPTGDVHVYLTVPEALREVFPRSAQYITETNRLTDAQKREAERALGRRLDGGAYEAVLCYDAAGAFLGYAVISDEMGKYRPITYIVGVSPQFRVVKVAVMVYRESRGGEVRTPRFLYQFRNKTASDPLRINRDIINISGATISVRAVSAGVRKVLYLLAQRYRTDPPAATYGAERRSIGGAP